jgi:hypothetical protein
MIINKFIMMTLHILTDPLNSPEDLLLSTAVMAFMII